MVVTTPHALSHVDVVKVGDVKKVANSQSHSSQPPLFFNRSFEKTFIANSSQVSFFSFHIFNRDTLSFPPFFPFFPFPLLFFLLYKGVAMYESLRVPTLAVVENMAFLDVVTDESTQPPVRKEKKRVYDLLILHCPTLVWNE